MLKRFLRNEKGLTLIELLAVVVILGIIAAIAVPSIGGLINKTKDDALKADAVQVLNAAKLYVTTNTRVVDEEINKSTDDPKSYTITNELLDGYLDNKPESYSVTVYKEDGKYKYKEISVTKNGKIARFDTEDDVLNGTGTIEDATE
jgi:type IV pilus assembly protein PilA|nr:prepilin-type N-terminal cleavage/methylation domain-containing protein [Bacillus alveayuensis]